MKISFVIISTLYFLSISATLKNILNAKIKKIMFCSACLISITTAILTSFLGDITFAILSILILIVHAILLFCSFTDIKFKTVLYLYVLFYSINSALSAYITIIASLRRHDTQLIDLIVNIITVSIYLSICFSKKNIKLKQLHDCMPNMSKVLILCISLIEMLLMALVIDESFYSNTATWFTIVQKVVGTAVFLTFVFILILISTNITNTHLKNLTQNYEHQIQVQAEHYKDLAAANHDVRRFKHDFKNISIAIKKLLADGNNSEALELITKCNNELCSTESTVSEFRSGNGIADALLTDKQKRASAVNATIKFEGMIPAERLSPTDICVLLGNTLDNAIEACEKCTNKENKVIAVNSDFVGSILFIKITNPVAEKVNVTNNYVRTTKENKTLHGFGLYSLSTIVKKYSGSLDINSTDDTFTVNMDLHLTA